MRLRQISSIEEANAYLPKFIEAHNKRFSVQAQSPKDAHKPLYHSVDALKRILSVQTTRKLSKNLQFSHNCALYQIERPGGGYRFRHAEVAVCEHTDGSIEVLYNRESLKYKMQKNSNNQPLLVDTKEINAVLDHIVSLTATQKQARYPQGPQPQMGTI